MEKIIAKYKKYQTIKKQILPIFQFFLYFIHLVLMLNMMNYLFPIITSLEFKHFPELLITIIMVAECARLEESCNNNSEIFDNLEQAYQDLIRVNSTKIPKIKTNYEISTEQKFIGNLKKLANHQITEKTVVADLHKLLNKK